MGVKGDDFNIAEQDGHLVIEFTYEGEPLHRDWLHKVICKLIEAEFEKEDGDDNFHRAFAALAAHNKLNKCFDNAADLHALEFIEKGGVMEPTKGG
jgi:hypothetical protein